MSDARSGVLSADDLVAITGHTAPSYQAKFLREQKLHPFVTRNGVRITWEAVNARMSGAVDAVKAAAQASSPEPNWAALKSGRRQ